MLITVFGKNYNPSDSLVKITEKKCEKLAKRLESDRQAEMRFTVTLENDEYTTDLYALTSRGEFRASATSRSPFDNLDEVIPKFLGQLRKQKDIEENSRRPADKKEFGDDDK